MSLSRGEFHHLLSPEPEFILRRWGAEGTTAADDSLIRNAGLKGGRRHFISPDDCTSSGSPHHHLTLAVSNSGLYYTSRPPPTFRLGFASAASLYDISHPLLSVLPGYTSSQHRHLKDSSRLGSSAQDFPVAVLSSVYNKDILLYFLDLCYDSACLGSDLRFRCRGDSFSQTFSPAMNANLVLERAWELAALPRLLCVSSERPFISLHYADSFPPKTDELFHSLNNQEQLPQSKHAFSRSRLQVDSRKEKQAKQEEAALCGVPVWILGEQS
ncbi:uncharacterized protein [Nothobranchius furzeri]|uniref:uncharacterized protein n=1 Tax=Nothobranchius furzeri TaxID=105023 RepID=UPI003904AFCF